MRLYTSPHLISVFSQFLFFELWLIVFTIYGNTPSVTLTKKTKLFKSGQSGQIHCKYEHGTHCSDNDFLVHDFFCATFNFLNMVDFDECVTMCLMYARSHT